MGGEREDIKVCISQAGPRRGSGAEGGKEEEINKEVDKHWRERRKGGETEAWESILSALHLWDDSFFRMRETTKPPEECVVTCALSTEDVLWQENS